MMLMMNGGMKEGRRIDEFRQDRTGFVSTRKSARICCRNSSEDICNFIVFEII